MNEKKLYVLTSVLFFIAAAVSGIGPNHDYGMTAVWIAIGACFVALGMKKPD